MLDLAWLSKEATQIHSYFESLFYAFSTVLILIGVIIEQFNLPLTSMPAAGSLVGRALVAAILLHAYPEVSGLCADITDGISHRLGDLNQFKVVLDRMGDRLQEFSWSWVSVKGSLVLAVSFLTFFLLYFSVHVAQAFLLYTYTLLYVFSPILIGFYVLPQTAGATSALYRSLFEASCWKIVWAVLATLLWSTGVSDIAQHQNLLAAITFNLVLAGSLILTPFVVHALAGRGLSSMAGTFGSVAVGGLATFTPTKVASAAISVGAKLHNSALAGTEAATNRFPKVNRFVQRVPRFPSSRQNPNSSKRNGEKPR